MNYIYDDEACLEYYNIGMGSNAITADDFINNTTGIEDISFKNTIAIINDLYSSTTPSLLKALCNAGISYIVKGENLEAVEKAVEGYKLQTPLKSADTYIVANGRWIKLNDDDDEVVKTVNGRSGNVKITAADLGIDLNTICKVKSVNGKTGDIVLSASDLGIDLSSLVTSGNGSGADLLENGCIKDEYMPLNFGVHLGTKVNKITTAQFQAEAISIEKSSGYATGGIYVNATSGKWSQRSGNIWCVQVNAGTEFYFPVISEGTIGISCYSSGITAPADLFPSREVTSSGVTYYWRFDESGFVTLPGSNKKYIKFVVDTNTWIKDIFYSYDKDYSVKVEDDITKLEGDVYVKRSDSKNGYSRLVDVEMLVDVITEMQNNGGVGGAGVGAALLKSISKNFKS